MCSVCATGEAKERGRRSDSPKKSEKALGSYAKCSQNSTNQHEHSLSQYHLFSVDLFVFWLILCSCCYFFVHSFSAFTHFSLLKVASSFHGIDRYQPITLTLLSPMSILLSFNLFQLFFTKSQRMSFALFSYCKVLCS